MDAFLILILLAIVLSVGGTIISLLLFAHGSEHVSHQRSARRFSLIPITNTNFSIEDRETARYARRTIASVVILLAVLGGFMYSAFHVLVAH